MKHYINKILCKSTETPVDAKAIVNAPAPTIEKLAEVSPTVPSEEVQPKERKRVWSSLHGRYIYKSIE